jgi:hypothetical protein
MDVNFSIFKRKIDYRIKIKILGHGSTIDKDKYFRGDQGLILGMYVLQ